MGRAATVALRETMRKPTRSPLVLAAMHSVWPPSLGPLAWGRRVVAVVAAGVTSSRLPGALEVVTRVCGARKTAGAAKVGS